MKISFVLYKVNFKHFYVALLLDLLHNSIVVVTTGSTAPPGILFSIFNISLRVLDVLFIALRRHLERLNQTILLECIHMRWSHLAMRVLSR